MVDNVERLQCNKWACQKVQPSPHFGLQINIYPRYQISIYRKKDCGVLIPFA